MVEAGAHSRLVCVPGILWPKPGRAIATLQVIAGISITILVAQAIILMNFTVYALSQGHFFVVDDLIEIAANTGWLIVAATVSLWLPATLVLERLRYGLGAMSVLYGAFTAVIGTLTAMLLSMEPDPITVELVLIAALAAFVGRLCAGTLAHSRPGFIICFASTALLVIIPMNY